MKPLVRRSVLVLTALVAGVLSAAPAAAQAEEPFTQARFEALQAQGALVLIDVFADWCPTCAAQQEVLAEFRAQHPEIPLHTLTVDFDKQKDWVRHFEAPRQSTFALYKGEERVWFAVAETRKEEIFAKILAAAAQP